MFRSADVAKGQITLFLPSEPCGVPDSLARPKRVRRRDKEWGTILEGNNSVCYEGDSIRRSTERLTVHIGYQLMLTICDVIAEVGCIERLIPHFEKLPHGIGG